MQSHREELSPGARVFDVTIYHGDIIARATEGESWQFEWASERDEEPLFERDGDTIRIQQPGEPVNPPRLNLQLWIPVGTEVIALRTGNGRIEAEGLRAQINLQTGNGDLTLRTAGGDVTLDTGNGQVQASSVDGKLQAHTGHGSIILQDAAGETQLNTGAGKIEIVAPRSLTLSAHSGHGEIHIGEGRIQAVHAETNAGRVVCGAELAEGDHRLVSGHGDVEVRAVRGTVELRTGAGRIGVADTLGRLEAHTGHGDVVLQSAMGEVQLTTGAGRIEVKVPRELHLRARSGNGDILVGDGSVQTLHCKTGRGNVVCTAALSSEENVAMSSHGEIIVRNVRGQTRLTTNNGKIEIAEADGQLRAHTGNGDIIVRSAAGVIELDTKNGRLEIGTARAAELKAHSGHGDVQVREGSVRALHLDTSMGPCSVALISNRANTS
jgi:DUF4097 and DUF4098 domain-containing protein YvlB